MNLTTYLQHDSHIHGEYIIFAPNRDAESLKLIKQFNLSIVQNSAQIKLQNNSIFDDGGHNDSAQGLTENWQIVLHFQPLSKFWVGPNPYVVLTSEQT